MPKDYYLVRGARIKRHENTILFEFNEGDKKAVPIKDIRSIHVLGEADFNTKLLVFLSQNGIPLHFYNYYGYYAGTFYPRELLPSGFLLVKQVEFYLDHVKRVEIAKEVVRAALHNILVNVKRYSLYEKVPSEIVQEIANMSEKLDYMENIPEIMSIEGHVRKLYYYCWNFFLKKDFGIDKRIKQPPGNEVNALISFGNSLLYATTLTEIYHTQLNPTISYLHEPGERRFSLALDISEIFKPVIVDHVIFNLVNNKIIKSTDFLEELNGIYLNENGRRLFLKAYQEKLNTTIRYAPLRKHVSYQRLIRFECYKLVRHLLGEAKYKGFQSKV
jgi:CRISPR-associated protein Cas1